MADSTKSEEPPEIREFALFLMDRPATHVELSEKFNALVKAVQDTGKKGTLSLTFTVGLFDGDPGRVVIDDKITYKVPEHDRKSGIFFPDKNGNLSRTDPESLAPEMFKNFDTKTGEMKEV